MHPCTGTEALYRPYGPQGEQRYRCTVQALRLCTGRTAHRGSRGTRIALLLLDHGTRKGRGVSLTPRPLFTPGENPVPFIQEPGWAPGPVWTGVENLALTGIGSPDLPARSQSLYQLPYTAERSTEALIHKISVFMKGEFITEKPCRLVG